MALHTNSQAFVFQVANTPYLISKVNPKRVGMLIQNPTTNATMVCAFGTADMTVGFQLVNGASRTCDVITPTDQLWAMSTVAGVALIVEEVSTQ